MSWPAERSGNTPGMRMTAMSTSAHCSPYTSKTSAGTSKPTTYVSQVIRHCERIAAGIGATKASGITAEAVKNWLHEQRKLARGRKRPMAPSTSNHYLRSIKSFTLWLDEERSVRDQLRKLKLLDISADVRKRRRALTAPETTKLLQVVRADQGDFRGLVGLDRFWLYSVALTTGYRAGELASVQPRDFRLRSPRPVLCVAAAHTKNGKDARQPVPSWMVEELRGYLEAKPDGAPVWPGSWATAAFKMVRRDLALARAKWLDEADKDDAECQRRSQDDFLRFRTHEGDADFHSIRHTYLTMLGRSGANPTVMQELARHYDFRQTKQYVHVNLVDMAAAVEELPRLALAAEPAALAATGTDSGPLAPALAHGLSQTNAGTCVGMRGTEAAVAATPLDGSRVFPDGLRLDEGDCEEVKEGWVTGFEPATFRATV
jgi:integrase